MKKKPARYARLAWIGWTIAALVGAATAALLVLLVVDDVSRSDGVIAEAARVVGREVREFKAILRLPFRGASVAPDQGVELSAIGVRTATTGLINLRISRHALLGMPRCAFGNPGAIEIDRDGLLLGHCSGRFFRVRLGEDGAIEDTGVVLPMHWKELLAYAPQTATQPDTSLNLLDLLRLRNGKTAVSFTQWNDERKCFLFSVAIIDFSATPVTQQPVFEARPCMQPDLDRGEEYNVFNGHQAGGRLTQTSDHILLVSVGDFTFDGGNHPQNLVQDPNADLGKVIEINLESGASRHVSIGHRNPQGLAHTQDWRVFETEHGPQGGDEVNLIRDGANYGWPFETLGVEYGGDNWALAMERGGHSHYQKPLFAFMPSIGISQLMEARGFAREWEGDLLVASLTGRTLHRLRLNGDSVLYDEPIRLNQRLRDMVQMPGGRIAILTDDYEILVIEADREGEIQSALAEAPEPVRQVLTKCLECHALSANDTSGRIPLAGIVGRNVAGWPEFDYSDGLRAVGGVWTVESLDTFLAAPGTFAPGTPMASKAIRDPEIRRGVIDLLGRLTLAP